MPNLNIIYVGGTSHSGSTLLDLMLNAHPDIFSVGELGQLGKKLQPKLRNYHNVRAIGAYPRCSCGAPSLLECAFWSSVNARTQSISGRSLQELNLHDQSLGRSHAPDIVLFRAIAEVSGAKFLVDSSKTPRRLEYLIGLPELNVFPIHLIREPCGHIWSMKRKHGGFSRHILRYEITHLKLRNLLKRINHVVIHYHDLVRKPESSLADILSPLGLKFDQKQLSWADSVNHNIAGNRMRHQHESTLVLDNAWIKELSFFQKLIVYLATSPSRHALSGPAQRTYARGLLWPRD